MKRTLRIIFPQWQGGTGPDYTLGARVAAFLAPRDTNAFEVEIPVDEHGSYELEMENKMYARSILLKQLESAMSIIEGYQPDHIITFGGDCLVDQAPISYLNQKYGDKLGVMWVDAHPDISNTDIFPNGNSMVVGNLIGQGDPEFASKVNKFLTPNQFLYCGVLKSTNAEEQKLVEKSGIAVISPEMLGQNSDPVKKWIKDNKFQYIMVHLDVDVIKPELFHSNVFEKPEPISTDCSHGKMSFAELTRLFRDIKDCIEFVGFTITEHLPWDMMELKNFLSDFPIFQND